MRRLSALLVAGAFLAWGNARAWAVEADPISPGSWTMVLLPDTQYYCDTDAKLLIFKSQTEWIRDHAASHQIKMVLQQGDLTDENNAAQYARAKTALGILETNGIPYSVALGNHDCDQTTRSSVFNNSSYFGPGSTYALQSHFQDPNPTTSRFFEAGKTDNSWCTFTAGGKDWLVFSAEFGPRNEVVAWMDSVAEAHPGYNFILNTHAYLFSDSTRYDWATYGANQRWNPHSYSALVNSGTSINDGQELWDKLIKKHEGWVFTFNGHVLNDEAGYLTSVDNNGNVVHQMLANYQNVTNGGNGYLRILEFMADGDTVKVSTYSPYSGAYFAKLTSYDQQFTLKMSEPMRPVPVIHGVSSASLNVTTGTTNATSVWSIPGTGPGSIELLTEPNVGDVSVMVDKTPMYRQQGVMMATVRQNVRNGYYGTVEVFQNNGFAGLDANVLQIATSRAYNGGEYNVNVAAAIFPFADGWISGHVAAGGALREHYGIAPSNVSTGSNNRFVLTIDGIHSQSDGMLFAVGGNNGDHFLSTAPMADGSWQVAVRNDTATTFDDIEDAPWSFVYVDYDAPGLIGGRISAAGGTLGGAGSFSVSRAGLAAGAYRITINGGQYTPDEGILLLAIADSETNGITAPDDNVISYEAAGNTFLVNIRDRNGPSSSLEDCGFVFAFLPYDGRLMPAMPGDANYDGRVDEGDAAVLASYWGDANATWAMGDFNLDGWVNSADASILAANWTRPAGEGDVPEPSVLALLAGFLAVLLPRQRRSSRPDCVHASRRWPRVNSSTVTTGRRAWCFREARRMVSEYAIMEPDCFGKTVSFRQACVTRDEGAVFWAVGMRTGGGQPMAL